MAHIPHIIPLGELWEYEQTNAYIRTHGLDRKRRGAAVGWNDLLITYNPFKIVLLARNACVRINGITNSIYR